MMNVAVSDQPGREDTALKELARADEIASVTVFDSMVAAEPFWRRLEADRALMTPYQRFDLLAAWQQHIGERAGVKPFIVTGFGRKGEPVFLWPFGRTRLGPLSIARFLGSKHANFNIGLWRRDIASAVAASDIRGVFDRFAASDQPVDVLALFSQPYGWDGIANPLALLPRQSSVDRGMRLTIDRPSEALFERILSRTMRGRLDGKARKLSRLPGYRYRRAVTAADIDRLLDAFFTLKSVHMAQHGIRNVFAAPGVAQFLRTACHCRLSNGRHLIEIHALEADDEVLAIFAVAADDYRCTSMFNTYTLTERSRHSPGLILIRQIIADCAARGLRGFDLGVGKAKYKSVFCNEPEPLFDTFLGLTPLGKLAAPAMGAASAAKRLIKEKPSLWAAVQTLRRMRARD